jgi:Large ribosomal RNA subunit accumulation protein YceD
MSKQKDVAKQKSFEQDTAEQKPAAPETSGLAELWSVPVKIEEVTEAGRHFDLVADAGTRAAVARVAALRDLPRLEATFDVTRRGADGLHVTGLVSATVGQDCVVTLEPLTNEVEEKVDLNFVPRQAVLREEGDTEAEPREPKWDDPEPLVDGVVDLAALATEFLILGLDPYPRKAGAVFDPPAPAGPEDGPFAALAKLNKG